MTNKTCKIIDEKHTNFFIGIANLLQTLCLGVKKVRVTVEREPYPTISKEEASPSKERPIEVPSMTPHRKFQVIFKELNLGTSNHNAMIEDISHVGLDFSVVLMYLLHNI